MEIQTFPTTTLSNGITVANYSSPHPFNFSDGSLLEAVPPEVATSLSLTRQDEERPFPGLEKKGITAVVPRFILNSECLKALDHVHSYWDVDVVIVPLPVLQALREAGILEKFPKVATICVADRVSKAIHIDRFCR